MNRRWMQYRSRFFVKGRCCVFVAIVLAPLAFSRIVIAAEQGAPLCPTLDTVVVTESRIPRELCETGHAFSIVTREQIDASGAESIPDLLAFVGGIDLRQRSGHGVQADVSIRGGSFEQVLILIDGVKMNDVQTGHHNMDLPVNIQDIERIEILKGPAARVYGQNAMAGVINIITRDVDQVAGGIHGKYGDHDYYDIGAWGATKQTHAFSRLSVSRQASRGHLEDKDTDFDIKTASYKGGGTFGRQQYQLGLAYSDKDFGAYRFYSDTFPDQREATRTFLGHVRNHFWLAEWDVRPLVFWRHHNDDFKIAVHDTWLENHHKTDNYGIQVDTKGQFRWGRTAIGGALNHESIKSTNLGDHRRRRSEIFLEQRLHPLHRMTPSFGMSAAHYSQWGWELCPGADLNIRLASGLQGFISAERSFRVPTFLELHYYTPANQGNPDLKPEQAWTYETGIRWYGKGFSGNMSLFLRDENNMIDWARASDQDPWKAQNLPGSTTQGLDADFSLYPGALWHPSLLAAVSIAYAYLESDRNTGGLESKYALDHLRHQLAVTATFDLSNAFKSTVKVRYAKRMTGDSFVVADARIAYQAGKMEVFLEANNVFNEEYVEAGFAPMPGRWIIGGVRFTLARP